MLLSFKNVEFMTIKESEMQRAIWDAVRKTINKFRRHPYYFFTESDIHSYFYNSLYSSKFEVERDNRRIYLIHREYPTNFRYCVDDLLNPEFEPYPLSEKKGDRGSFDIAVLNPEFVMEAPSIEDIVNKNVRLVKSRVETDLDSVKKELLFAIEFKYVINDSKNYIDEIKKDNRKLEFSKQWGAKEAINLVFCNIRLNKNDKEIKKSVLEASNEIRAYFIQSYYLGDNKIPQKIIKNAKQ